MLQLFRQNLFLNSILLLPYTCLVRIYSLINPRSYQSSEIEGVFNHSIFTALADLPLLQSILAIVLLFIQGVCINYLSNANRLQNRASLFPGLIYILLMSLHRDFLFLTPILLANTFLIIGLLSIMKTYRVSTCSDAIFNTSFFIGMASSFYLPYFLFLIPGFVGLVILRSFNLRERILYVAGAIVYYYLFFSVLFFFSTSKTYFLPYFKANLPIPNFSSFGIIEYSLIALTVILAILSIVNYYNLRKKKSIQVQKKIDIFYWFLFTSPIVIFFWHLVSIQSLIVFIIPLSLFFAMILYNMRNKGLAELIHLVFLATLFFIHFQSILGI